MRLLPCAAALATGAAFVVAMGGCAHVTYGSVPIATPTPVVTATPSAAPCIASAAAGAQIVAISPLISQVVDPTFGIVGGYGLVVNGNVANTSAPIDVASTAVIQFFDNDQSGSQLRYSAVGIPDVSAFPAPTYTFPPATINQTGTVISATTAWSTGLLAGQCYSQSFTLAGPGTYYFGDYTYYGLGNIRDVIVATASP